MFGMMQFRWAAPLGLLLVSCNGDGSGPGDDATASGTGVASTGGVTATTTAGTVTTTGNSASDATDPSAGSESNGMTMGTTGTTGASNPTTTIDPTTGTTGEPGTSTGGSSTTSGVVPGTTTTGEPGTSSTGGDSSSTGADSTTGPPPVCEPGMGMGMGMIDKSYIWIASYNSNDVSKVDTLTMTELARYRTGPQNASQNPSRTAVIADGRFTVVNNRDSGRSTMFAANLPDCIDKDGNGQIETSQNKANLLDWATDECMIWSITHPVAGGTPPGPRGVTWTPGEWSYEECKYVNPKVWIGYLAANNTAKFAKVDGLTGALEETLSAPAWGGSGYAPYGAALDPQFRPWFSSLRGEFVRVNTDENPTTITRIAAPASVQSYGFTVDQDGNAWFGGCSGPVTVYDQKNGTFTPIVGTSACHRGVAADEKFVWVASNGPCGLVQVDRLARTLVAKHVPAQCNTAIGLSIDLEKNVWLVDQGGYAWKFKPDNVPAMQKIIVAGSHYVYSDMTGGQLQSILPQ